MPSVVAYHRPASLDEALVLLAEPHRRALAGGTIVVPEARVVRASGIELVDLQDSGLDSITPGPGTLRLGAMVRLGQLPGLAACPALLAELARRELPSTMRFQATVGGTVAHADPDSALVAGLLAHDATVELSDGTSAPLADLVADDVPAALARRLITAVTLSAGGPGAWAATGRTPADDPIVAAVARRAGDGTIRLALTGVAPHPRLVDPGDPTVGLSPPGDFRGSPAYRLHLARVLSQRALAGLDTDGETR